MCMKNNTPYLDEKVDNFINNYSNSIKGNFNKKVEYFAPRKMRDLIEKMAVWYELKYPNYVIDNNIKNTDKTYSTNNFINNLPVEEKCYFDNPMLYNECVGDSNTNVFLDRRTGIIKKAKGIYRYTEGMIKDKYIVGFKLERFYKLLNDFEINNGFSKNVKDEVEEVSKYKDFQNDLLDSIMYRIIERGGPIEGSRRGFLFAREFKRDTSIPMRYINPYDPKLGKFIKKYIKYNGNFDIDCYPNYFNRTSDNDTINTISLREIVNIRNLDIGEKGKKLVK